SASGLTLLGCLYFWQLFVLEFISPAAFGWTLAAGVTAPVALVWAAIAIHELGHLLVARAAGLRVQLVIMGPVRLARAGLRFRARVNWRSATPGLVLAAPADGRDLAGRLAAFVAAGPVANLVAGLL